MSKFNKQAATVAKAKPVKLPKKAKPRDKASSAGTIGALTIRKLRDNRMLLEQPPGMQLFYYGPKGEYLLPMPWIYYDLTWTKIRTMSTSESTMPVNNRFAATLAGILCSAEQGPDSNRKKFYLSALPLPNMYGARPCFSQQVNLGQITTREEAINAQISSFWDARGNTDGNYYEHPVWEHLIKLTKATDHRSCPKVLRQWEKLSFEEVFALPWGQQHLWADLPKGSYYGEDGHNYEDDDEYYDDE